MSRDAQKAGVEVLILDGNHEHHLNLRKCARNADPQSENGRPVQLHPDLWYLPRGCAWEWGGTKFRAMGGAFSVDKPFRMQLGRVPTTIIGLPPTRSASTSRSACS